jgi:hypothetical protein
MSNLVPNQVVDLTRRFDNQLNEISLSTVKVANGKLSKTNADYLQEVHLGSNFSACYFKDGVPTDKDSFYYEIAWLKIPTGFQYVDYQANGTRITNYSNRKPPLNVDILTPLLMLFDEKDAPSVSDLCTLHLELESESNTLGCSGCIKAHAKKYLAPTGFRTMPNNNKPFILFHYNGPLRTDALDRFDRNGVEQKGGYFLIPLYLSQKIIVYYCFAESKLQQVYDDAMNETFIEIDAALAMNDSKGIFVTNEYAVPKKNSKPKTKTKAKP